MLENELLHGSDLIGSLRFYLCLLTVRVLQPAVWIWYLAAMIVIHLRQVRQVLKHEPCWVWHPNQHRRPVLTKTAKKTSANWLNLRFHGDFAGKGRLSICQQKSVWAG